MNDNKETISRGMLMSQVIKFCLIIRQINFADNARGHPGMLGGYSEVHAQQGLHQGKV